MKAVLPFEFALVGQAVSDFPFALSYPQLEQKVHQGDLRLDSAACFKGQWLLDYAIEQRNHSSKGAREFSKRRRACTSMDALWAEWMRESGALLGGDEEASATRIARLLRVGSVECLDTCLSVYRGNQNQIEQKWKQESPAIGDFWRQLARLGHAETLDTLLKRSIRPSPEQGFAAWCRVNDVPTAKCLLKHEVSPEDPAGQHSVFEQWASYGLAPGKREVLTGLLQARVSDSPQARISRLAKDLEKKTKAQGHMEMRDAQWSPKKRGTMRSPVALWAEAALKKGGVHFGKEGFLDEIIHHPSATVPQPAEKLSEAAMAWAVLYPRNPEMAERYAALATDLPQATWPERLHHLISFSSDYPLLMPYAVESSLTLLMRQGDKLEEGAWKNLWDGWFGKGRDNPAVLEGFAVAFPSWQLREMGEKIHQKDKDTQSAWVTLALTVLSAGSIEDELVARVHNAWVAGVRPFTAPAIMQFLQNRSKALEVGLRSEWENWVLTLNSQARPQRASSFRL